MHSLSYKFIINSLTMPSDLSAGSDRISTNIRATAPVS